jgi:hypothetical protein
MAQVHRLQLEVTQDIIDRSCVADSSHCMIADAVRRAVPDARSVTVDIQTIRYSLPGTRKRYLYLTPRQAQLALLDFDAGQKPQPFTAQLRPAMITAMRGNARTPRPEYKETHRASLDKAREFSPARGRAKLGGPVGNPRRDGGQPPPTGALAAGRGTGRTGDIPTARRRKFGLRGMESNRG